MKKLFTNNPAETIILILIVILVIIGIALGILPAPPIEPESGLLLMGLLPLLPCPFCGGQAWLKSRPRTSWVACEDCGMEVRRESGPNADETACNLWNTRPKQPQLPNQALTQFVVSDLDRIITALEAAHESLVEFHSEDAGHLADLLATLKTAEAGALVIDDGSDPAAYTLREGADAGRGVWIRIQNIDVRVYQGDEGVSVDLYPTNSPETDTLASTYLTFAEAAEESE